jgi:hypothetical protein
MFLVWSMNPAQWKSLGQCIYLLDKSRACAYYEPLSAQHDHERFVEYVRTLMDRIEAKAIEKWETDSHLWALHKTLEQRINKIKEIKRWTPTKS